MAATTYTPFMVALHAKIVANDCTESTASKYLQTLRKFNGDLPFKNLAFLRNTAIISALNAHYAESTQSANYATFVSTLRVEGLSEKPTYKKPFKFYSDWLVEERKRRDAAAEGGEAMTEKEKEAWLPWSEVVATHERLQKGIVPILGYKSLTIAQYNDLLNYTITSLYVLTPPRRCKDYHEMYLVPTWTEAMDKNANYYCHETKRFIFGAYKTAKAYGQQIAAIPEALQLVLNDFVRHHPILKGKVGPRTEPTRLFVNYDGTFNDSTNFITRILQKVFKPHKISVDALRHIYLNNKLDIKAMVADASAMAHSLSTQRAYLRTDAPATGAAGGAGAGAGASYYEPVGDA